jgi:hypothetical protein
MRKNNIWFEKRLAFSKRLPLSSSSVVKQKESIQKAPNFGGLYELQESYNVVADSLGVVRMRRRQQSS